MLKTALPHHALGDDGPKAPNGPLSKTTISPKNGPSLQERPPTSASPSAERSAAQSVCEHLRVRPSRALRPQRTSTNLPRRSGRTPAQSSHIQAALPPLPTICQTFQPGASPGDHQNAIRDRITRFDKSKGKVDFAWFVGLVIDAAFTCAIPGAGSLAGIGGWLGNLGDFNLVNQDYKLSNAQYKEAQTHRGAAVQAWKELAQHVAAHPEHQQAMDLLAATAEIVKLLDGVLNSYENFYKPPTEAALRQELRSRLYQYHLKDTQGTVEGRQQDAAHVAELAALKARVEAMLPGRKKRRVNLARLRSQRTVLEKQLAVEVLSDDRRAALARQLADIDKDIKLLHDHRKAMATPVVLRKGKHFGQKGAKKLNNDMALVRIPLDVSNAALSMAAVVPQVLAASADAALGLPIAAALVAGAGAVLSHRSAELDQQEALKEKELHPQNIAKAYQAIEHARRLLQELDDCADSPQVRMQRRALLTQINAQVRFITMSKGSLLAGRLRKLKSKVMKYLTRLQIAAVIVSVGMTAAFIPGAGFVTMSVGLLATAVTLGFLAYVTCSARWREKTITRKLLQQQLAFEHAYRVLGAEVAGNLQALPLERIAVIAEALQLSAAPELRPYLTPEKLMGDNCFFTIEWMAKDFHAATQARLAGKDVQLKDYPGAAMAMAMGLPAGTGNYLLRGGQMFDAAQPEHYLDECRKLLAVNLFRLPVADAQKLAEESTASAEPLELPGIAQGELLDEASTSESLPASGAFTLSSPPVAAPRELSPELVATAIRDAGKKAWEAKKVKAFIRPVDSAKRLMKRQSTDGVRPEQWGRIVAELKEKLPRDPDTDAIAVPQPYTSVDDWLIHELPKTAELAIQTGNTFELMENTGQDKQRQSTRQRFHDLAAVTTHCTLWLKQPEAAAAA